MLDDHTHHTAPGDAKLSRIISPMQMRLLEIEGYEIVASGAVRLDRRVIDPPTVDDLLTGRVVPKLADICIAAAMAGRVTPKQLRGPGKARNLTRPRHMAMKFSDDLTSCTLSQIGYFYHRDHSTVLGGKRSIERALANECPTSTELRARLLSELPVVVFERLTEEQRVLR